MVCIDLQRVFADPKSPWGSPMWGPASAYIEGILGDYPRTIFTRYVAPERPVGAWRDYFEQWPWAKVSADDPLYALMPPFTAEQTLDRTTFGKWGPELAELLEGTNTVDVVGVSTDCCVVSTVLAMADAGVRTRVLAAGCAGSTPAEHERALGLMELYAPLVTVVR
ncbi:cysteine hydrolase [Calidifontibacter sp. DB0510]|uniref:Cysteine hydrolase n=1 Tax=Metallococcus carri TaxID=1656884 RepID=A0A967EDW4_9MICO|nr:cysteine hydrolase [Metallococcus carri]NOP36173.1 isochorismatase family protein [Calidifontibacter sp. DB2511S]